MAGAGPLGWATSTFCFLHGLFNLYVYCGNEGIRNEVQSGTFNSSGASQGDGFNKAVSCSSTSSVTSGTRASLLTAVADDTLCQADVAEWGAQNTDKVRAGAGQVAAGAQWASQNQDTVRAGVAMAQANPEMARNAVALAQSNPDAARALASQSTLATSGGTTAI
jgi:hypothetical protein